MFAFKWLGQGGFELLAGDKRIVIDPYLSNSVLQLDGFNRLMPLPIEPGELKSDLLITTHDHMDHLDPVTLTATDFSANTYAGPEDCLRHMRQIGIPEERTRRLGAGDVILKGANAIYTPTGETGVLIGHPQGGTAMPIISAVIGRRAGLIVPIGLEKRVDMPIAQLAAISNAADAEGPRLCPLPGKAFTELDALRALTGAEAVLLAAGGVMGAEGCVYLAASGTPEQMDAVRALERELRAEARMEL